MLIKPLTHAEVKNAKGTGKDYSLHDGFGLLLYVSKAGGKTWRFRYQHPYTKKRQTLTIGAYPEFTLAEAREARDEARRLVARGIDPNEEKRQLKAERIKRRNQTFEAVARDWLRVVENEGRRKNTMFSIYRTLNVYLFPVIGNISIHDIRADIFISHIKIYSDRPAMLDSIISRAKMVMDFAVNTGVVKYNPLTKVHKAFPAVKSKPINSLAIEKLPGFIKTWESIEVHPSVKYVLMFQILTMVRPNEAQKAKWVEVDLSARLWTIPADRMKGGREHVVPLSTQALSILERMRKIKKSEYIFYGANRVSQPITQGAVLYNLRQNNLKGEATPHGFRAMWSSLLNEEGFNPDVIEAALSHKSGNAIRDIYNRTTYLEQRRKMMQWVGDFYDSARIGIINRTYGKRGLRLINE